MIFHPIDMDHWSRKPYFEHYLHHVRCTYSMTANIDITLLLEQLKRKEIKLYPALIYMITTVVNRHSEFRTCFDSEGKLGYWDSMSSNFTIFHEDDKTFSNIWTPYTEDFQEFYSHYLDDLEKYGHIKQFTSKINEPPNTFPISCIPWVSFTGFNLNIYTEGTYLLPIFTIGKFFKQDEQIQLPLSVQLHHAVCDGYHTSVLFHELQVLADHCEKWLPNK
ncbi:type A chloramphenicol O-acetyltransferase [Risungbinella massiliensis]|uniref:type A chloramphenicol O-acetyltransferase n=1 Tax=Risungbinella massiliensis TaxID=1329796 RepID=UPI0005CBC808|nr:type A chloramphenicol O-acetyltransferase [Risungbinella massiliensis]